MIDRLLTERITISSVAAIAGVTYLVAALRVGRCGGASAPARYGVAASAFIISALAAFGILAPIIAYSITCFALVVVFLADVIREERMRRRRVAMLVRRPAADAVPAVWIAIALLSTFALLPYILGGVDVIAALITAVSAVANVAIAWRIASAPTQLTGDDIEAEQRDGRADRVRQIGLICVVTIGSIAVFLSFVNAAPPLTMGLGRLTGIEMLLVWAALWVWQAWYVRRMSDSASAAQ